MPTYTTGYQNNQRLRVVVDVTTNHSSNSSTVRVRQYQDRSSGYIASSDWEMFTSLDGSTLHNSTQYRSINSTTLITDQTRTISHANNGERTVRVLARSWTHATSLFRQEIDRTLTLTTIDTRPAKLGAPSVSGSGLSVTVTAPVASAPVPIQDYQHRYRRRLGNGAWTDWIDRPVSASRAESYSLTESYSYQFQARASTAGGWGAWGDIRSYLMPVVTAAPTMSRDVGLITVTAPVVSGATQYQNRRRVNTGSGYGDWVMWIASTSRETTQVIPPGSTMQAESRAANANGWGPWGPARALTMPDVTSAPTISRVGTTVTVTAAQVSSATIYQNRRRVNTGSGYGDWVAWVSSASRETTTPLPPGATIQAETRVGNEAGFGDYGPTRTFTMPNLPAAPSSVTLVADVRELTASWPQPSNGGDAITHYETQIRNVTTGGGWTDLRDTGLTRSVTYTGLQPGSEYEIRARAVNSVGNGDWRVSTPIRINAYGSRRTASGWVPVSHAYRRTSSGWVPIERVRRWTGTTWVDVT